MTVWSRFTSKVNLEAHTLIQFLEYSAVNFPFPSLDPCTTDHVSTLQIESFSIEFGFEFGFGFSAVCY